MDGKRKKNSAVKLIGTDFSESVIECLTARRRVYMPAGYCAHVERLMVGFNGQYLERSGVDYLLGHGVRAYSSRLIKFLQPDGFSPFANGGLNCYAYCSGDPINRADINGQASLWSVFKQLRRGGGVRARGAHELVQHPSNIALATLSLDTSLPAFNNIFSDTMRWELPEQIRHVKHYGRKVTARSDLAQLEPGKNYIYVVTDRHNLLISPRVASLNGNKLSISHAVLAKVLGEQRSVIAAGELKLHGPGRFNIDSASGHFKPTDVAMNHAARVIKQFGFHADKYHRNGVPIA